MAYNILTLINWRNIMPNWCQNQITINHTNPEMMEQVRDVVNQVGDNKQGLLEKFLPCPKELRDTIAGYLSGDEQIALEAKEKNNLLQYGHKNWYDWCLANWGTKWDIDLENVIENDDGSISASFDSAWSPPIEAYDTLRDLGFDIVAYYAEPGMCFAGKWDNGVDEYYEDAREASDELKEMFGIDEWFEDDDEDEQLALAHDKE